MRMNSEPKHSVVIYERWINGRYRDVRSTGIKVTPLGVLASHSSFSTVPTSSKKPQA